MGYLSRYDGTTRVELSEGYWVEVKNCLTGAQMEACKKSLISWRVVENDSGYAAALDRVDPGGLPSEVAIASLVSWNVDDAQGDVLPLEITDKAGNVLVDETAKVRRRNYGYLTSEDRDAVEEVVMRLNVTPTKREAATFPDEGERSAPAGTVTGPDGGEVL